MLPMLTLCWRAWHVHTLSCAKHVSNPSMLAHTHVVQMQVKQHVVDEMQLPHEANARNLDEQGRNQGVWPVDMRCHLCPTRPFQAAVIEVLVAV